MKLIPLGFAAIFVLNAQAPVPSGAKIYIHPMDGFGSYLHSAFRVKGVPVDVVGTRESAEYELTGSEEREEARRGRISLRLPGKGQDVVRLQLQRVATGEILMANTYGTKKHHGGKRGGAEEFAGELERKIRAAGGGRKAAAPAAEAPVTAVRFTSEPAYAELEVDGVYWGTTPTAELTRLAAGSHVVAFKKPGYQRWEQKLELKAGESQKIHAELQEAVSVQGKARIAGLE